MKDTAIFLCNLHVITYQPWKDAGYNCLSIDPQLPDNGTILEMIPAIREVILQNRVAFVGGFPPCDDVALCGTKHWEKKRLADRYFQARSAITGEQCRMIGELSGAPYFFENPKSAFTSIFGRPDYKFNPSDFGGYLPEDDVHPDYPDIYPPPGRLQQGNVDLVW